MKEQDATEIAFKNGYEKGKADGAREIFEEIQEKFKELYHEGKTSAFQSLVKAVNETEKKYTEDK